MAADIAKALIGREAVFSGNTYSGRDQDGSSIHIVYAEGHLCRLARPDEYDPNWKQWTLPALPLVPPQQQFRYHPLNARAIGHIRAVTRGAAELVNACDAGREGELIFWEIFEGCDHKPSNVSRMWIQATTPMALIEAFEKRKPQLTKKYQNLLLTAKMRQHADWLLGMNLSRYATLTTPEQSKALALGRVKTPVLSAIVRRESEFNSFEPTSFFRVPIIFKGKDFVQFKAYVLARDDERFGNVGYHFKDHLKAKERYTQAIRYLEEPWKCYDKIDKVEEHPPPPFNLTELQRAAAREYGWSAQETLDIAQEAYLKDKSISYPRTDSHHLPEAMADELHAIWRSLIADHMEFLKGPYPLGMEQSFDDIEFGKRFLKKRMVGDHYAIVPTGIIPSHTPEPGSGDEYLRSSYRLWELVTRRFLVSLMPSAELVTLSRTIVAERDMEELRALFDDAFVVSPGWLVVEEWVGGSNCERKKYANRLKYPDDYPHVEAGQAYAYKSSWNEGKTDPPEFYNDDTILNFMARKKLGTSATRAGILTELLKRNYIERRQSRYHPTEQGAYLVDHLAQRGVFELLDPDMTATWETLLERVARFGEKDITYAGFLNDVLQKVRYMGSLFTGVSVPDDVVFCPKSNRRVEDQGDFWMFPGYPDAKCRKVLLQREMKPSEFREILLAGSKGAGPFDGFISKRTGRPFSARLVYKTRFKRFDFDFTGMRRSGGGN